MKILLPVSGQLLKRSVFPLGATLILTRRCNMACRHCYLGNQQRIRAYAAGRELDTATFCQLLDQLAAMGTLDVDLTGGEVLLRQDFVEIYQHAARLGISLAVLSNGTLLRQEHVAALSAILLRPVEFTHLWDV